MTVLKTTIEHEIKAASELVFAICGGSVPYPKNPEQLQSLHKWLVFQIAHAEQRGGDARQKLLEDREIRSKVGLTVDKT